MREKIVVFTDGACSGNPGPGGWGAVIAFPEGHIKELGGQGDKVTNNQMELMATIKALAHLRAEPRPVILYTDSVYVIRGITQWIWGWMKRNWQNAEGGAIANQELWQQLKAVVDTRGKKSGIEWRYIRGHTGVPGNERCDEIAVKMTQHKWVDLYDGPLVKYPVSIYDLPQLESLPEMKAKQGPKPAAHSYLSYVGGKLRRHRNWSSCEKHTKGQAGARFKKAMTSADEASILAGWGLAGQKIEDVE